MSDHFETLLKVENLSVAFHQGGKTSLAVDGISFEIARGETLAIVGESGSGKSVSALSIPKLLPYPAASHPTGAVWFQGENLMAMDEASLRKVRGKTITMIFQEPMTSLNPLHTIERQISEIVMLHTGCKADHAKTRTLELLHEVGIPNPEQRANAYPHQLSGGQRQRVMIAMALANEPDLLIADEPTTALDVTVQAQILALLDDLKRRRGMSMLFITHDLGIVRKIADRVAVMTKGKIVETGPTAQLFDRPQHAYTKHLLAAEPKGRPDPLEARNAPLVTATDMKVWFPIKEGFFRKTVDHVRAVDGITLNIAPGETLGIVGESGSGKTTLGLAITRMIASEGAIGFDGQDISKRTFKQMRPLRSDIQIVFQDPYGSLSPRMSVAEIILEGFKIHQPALDHAAQDQMVIDVLNEVGLDPATRHRYPHEFSGGQRQRIAIARAMILKPKFVMLDEPTSALDMSVQAQVVDLLRDLQKKYGLAYLFISHDLKVVRALSHNVIVMREGKVVESGSSDQIFDAPKQAYTKALMKAAFNIEADQSGTVNQ